MESRSPNPPPEKGFRVPDLQSPIDLSLIALIEQLRSEHPDRVVTVLSVSQFQDDHAALVEIFSHSNWRLFKANSGEEAIRLAREVCLPVVISERNLSDHTWKDLLEAFERCSAPPELIVSSQHADERFWAEVLNLGAYDVLLKPFDHREVVRVVSMAWLQWKRRWAADPAPVYRAAAANRIA